MLNTWFKREERRKETLSIGEYETDIDFVLMKKQHRQSNRTVKAIPGSFNMH